MVQRSVGLAAALAMAAVLPFTASERPTAARERSGAAAERIDPDVNTRIRQEGLNNSQILRTVHVLTDLHGPRVTGSPSLEAAGKWAIQQMESWGLTNGRMEPWNFGRDGWTNDFAAGAIVAPVRDKLEFEVVAWTPGTAGTVTARAVQLVLPDRPTAAELTAHFESMRDQVKGAFVLVGRQRIVAVDFEPPAKRRTDAQVRSQYDPDPPPAAAPASPAGSGRSGRGQIARPGALTTTEIVTKLDDFLLGSGALVRIHDAGRAHGQIVAYNHRAYDTARTIPTVVLRNEDYGRIARILGDGVPVELQFTIVNRTHPAGRTAYNAIAEIPGTDKRDEVVMIGGHLDSWHSATGATDNAVGCAVMMEAARILKTIGVQPRRTIRVALWSGEEQGLLGSEAYVAQHFGSFENPKPAFDTLVAYLNLDAGSGRVRGASVFGPSGAAQVIRELVKPFEELGVFGAAATSSRVTGGTDHTSFNEAGLPGINFGLDPIEYSSHTHHTNLDTYERIVEQDVKESAVVIASLVYHLAMRDEPLPRFGKDQMPAPPRRSR